MNLDILRTELTAGHPITGVYSEDDAIAAGQLNTINRTRIRTSMTGDEVFAATDPGEFGALTEHKRLTWLSLCGRSATDPAETANEALVKWIFGASSATLTALVAARTEHITRAAELGLGFVYPGHVENARY